MNIYRLPLIASLFCLLLLSGFSLAETANQSSDVSPPSPSPIKLIPHKAFYKAEIEKGLNIKGTAVRELKRDKNGNWRYRFDVDSFAADIKESVAFEWRDNRVIPLNYNYDLSGFFIKDKYQKISFDWSQKKAAGRHDGKKWTLDLLDNAVDRLGYQLQLIIDIQRNLAKPDSTPMIYEVVHRAKHRDGEFELIGPQTLDTSLGKLDTIKVMKKRSEEKKRETHLWFSEPYPFILLKMVQVEDDGERYEINLSSAESEGQKLF